LGMTLSDPESIPDRTLACDAPHKTSPEVLKTAHTLTIT